MTRFGIETGRKGPRHGATSALRPSGRSHARRQRLVTCGFTLASFLYALRLGYLQVFQGEEMRERVLAQSATLEEIPAPRGAIRDRSGQALAAHDTHYRASLAVRELTIDRSAAIAAIRDIVGLEPERERALRGATGGWTRFAAGVTDEERVGLERRIGPGVHFESQPARAHPSGSLARRLLGGIHADGRPSGGLELHLDSVLRGEPGLAELRLDGLGRAHPLPGGERVKPRPGLDVYLTIDAGLQRIAENELARAMAETGAPAGDILILDPGTGELLAVASERGGTAAGHVPAFSDPYEPGSTLKPFLLASLLGEDLIDLADTLDVENGVLRAGTRTIRDVHAYDRLTVREIVTHSSNVGAAKLAARLRPRVQHRYLRDFGFGIRTWIEHPSESDGMLLRPEAWTSMSPASHAMGYELSVTSLQLAAAYGALANDGVLMRPRLVREIRDARGRPIRTFEPQAVRRVVSSEVARAVSDVLEDVVEEGTGTMARMATLSVAGKTGTAKLAEGGRYLDGRYRASFVGYAPADDPRVVILTRLEDPAGASYYGGAIAAPTSQATLQAALAMNGARIDPASVASAHHPRRWSGRGGADGSHGPAVFAAGGIEEVWPPGSEEAEAVVPLPDVTGLALRSAAARLHELGLRVEWRGTEEVRTQSPAAGSRLRPGDMVVLR